MNTALVYFDLFEYPLTALEMDRFAYGEPAAQGEGGISAKWGLYWLRGRDEIVATRRDRYILAEPKFARARKAARLISYLPFVRLVAVCNSLAYNNARQESDIDLFVVTSRGGAWWARFFGTLVMHILRLRPGQNGIRMGAFAFREPKASERLSHADKICLSFFVDEDNLNISRLSLGKDDIYLRYWIATLYPLYDAGLPFRSPLSDGAKEGGYYQKFWSANKELVQEKLPNARPVITHPDRQIIGSSPSVRLLIEFLLRPFTPVIRKLQEHFMAKEIKALANKDTRVVLEKGVLKFHVNDRREQYRNDFFKRFKEMATRL